MTVQRGTTALLVTLGFAAADALSGCKARDLGTSRTDREATSADPSWIAAANACWPELNASNGIVSHNLVDPEHLRTIFSTYGGYSNDQLRTAVTQPIQNAPPPDGSVLSRSERPVLTRSQAANGADPHTAPIPGRTGAVPEDALCSVQSGSPIGFK